MHERRAEIQLEERFVLSAKYVDEEGKKDALIQGPLGGKQQNHYPDLGYCFCQQNYHVDEEDKGGNDS